ncbi:hypothetical protein BJF79_22570 [Actinomadura sp. CNU-125]|nr:hypothetical protein BJF79_22570 [Actinomadura sp. CNU-125]
MLTDTSSPVRTPRNRPSSPHAASTRATEPRLPLVTRYAGRPSASSRSSRRRAPGNTATFPAATSAR